MGLMVEIPDMGVRGVVKREDLPEGRWRLEGHRGAWVSSEGDVVAIGMRIPLRVTGLDREKRFVDFAVAGRPTSAGIKPSGSPAPTKSRSTFKPAPVAATAKHRGKPKPKPAAKAGPPPGKQRRAKNARRRR
jgi:hypothetical protein